MKVRKPSEKQYLSIPRVASILGMSRVAVYKKVKRGEIKTIKIGRTYGIPQSYLTEMTRGDIDAVKRKKINWAVKKVVKEYGELLRKLGNE